MTAMRIFSKFLSGRASVDLLLVVSAFMLPWWFTMLSALLCFFVFERFVEFFLLAFVLDLLYGGTTARLPDSKFTLSLVSVILYLVFSLLKARMRLM